MIFYLFILLLFLFIQQPLLQYSVSHDPSEIILICWLVAQVKCILIVTVENGCAA